MIMIIVNIINNIFHSSDNGSADDLNTKCVDESTQSCGSDFEEHNDRDSDYNFSEVTLYTYVIYVYICIGYNTLRVLYQIYNHRA